MYIGPFKIIVKVGLVAYRLELPQELSSMHSTFHISNLKKCLSDESLIIPLGEIQVDDKLHFIKEPMDIIDQEIKQLKKIRTNCQAKKFHKEKERNEKLKQGKPDLTSKDAPECHGTPSQGRWVPRNMKKGTDLGVPIAQDSALGGSGSLESQAKEVVSTMETGRGQREIQSPTTNDDPGREAEPYLILRVPWKPFGYQANSGGKSQGGNKSRISGANNNDQFHPHRRMPQQVVRSASAQKKIGQAADKNQAIQEEVRIIMEAGIIKELHYYDWLSNPVMVKKHDDSWRICVDFKDLNKACPKDGYPLLEIDWKVESLCRFLFKCFLDAYKGYHQIQMAKKDEKNSIHYKPRNICYTKMPFGLRNAKATYQHLVDKAFHEHIGRNLEVYVDDLVIKSHTEDEIVKDIEETFKTLREINMKLNPKKCTFGVEEGMFS
uniref:Reverse transcriptase domain-containing protein n=1 Tax=Tanacetum cinerariifolium TaxID=118510 RepID=A0A6L2J9Q6_TANCI|nr:reverse transcriptase domain-containing protein [Tanacetum cinerariifolium]